mmetsp:Transcript_16553/g.36085  ORF Transcript_16553/g.36085 Transcript_16553/m.36085 type:complete len:181 (+) Transcript_16553:237-779(+)
MPLQQRHHRANLLAANAYKTQKQNSNRRRSKGDKNATRFEEINTRQCQIAHCLPKKGLPVRNESKFWGFRVYFESHRDAGAHDAAILKRQEKNERQAMREEDKRSRAAEKHRMECDYYRFIALVQRYGPCPGYIFCISQFPGAEYARHLDDNSTTLAMWWFRLRRRIRHIYREQDDKHTQ